MENLKRKKRNLEKDFQWAYPIDSEGKMKKKEKFGLVLLGKPNGKWVNTRCVTSSSRAGANTIRKQNHCFISQFPFQVDIYVSINLDHGIGRYDKLRHIIIHTFMPFRMLPPLSLLKKIVQHYNQTFNYDIKFLSKELQLERW